MGLSLMLASLNIDPARELLASCFGIRFLLLLTVLDFDFLEVAAFRRRLLLGIFLFQRVVGVRLEKALRFRLAFAFQV